MLRIFFVNRVIIIAGVLLFYCPFFTKTIAQGITLRPEMPIPVFEQGAFINRFESSIQKSVYQTNLDITQAFTVAGWLKSQPVSGSRALLRIYNKQEVLFSIVARGNNIEFVVLFDKPISFNIKLARHELTHFAISFANGYVKFYRNGDIVEVVKLRGELKGKADAVFIDEANSNAAGISKMKIYDITLNAARIRDLADVKLTSLDLNEGEGAATYEESGYATYESGINASWRTDMVFRKRLFREDSPFGLLKGAQWVKDSILGNVISFRQRKSHVSLLTVDSLHLSGQFTISCWVKTLREPARRRTIVSKTTDTGVVEFSLGLDSVTGYLSFYSMALDKTISSRVSLDDRRWYHLVVTYDGTLLKFYKNGILVTETKVSLSATNAFRCPLIIGNDNTHLSSFGGEIARVKLYGKSLRLSGIEDLYYETPMLHYKVNGIGVVEENESGNSFNTKVEDVLIEHGRGSSFPFAANFSKPTSRMVINGSHARLSNRFTIAAWIKLLPGKQKKRTLVSQGRATERNSWSLSMEYSTGSIHFESPSLSRNLKTPGIETDSLWHHVMVSLGDGQIRFYFDRQLIHRESVSGKMGESSEGIVVGASPDGAGKFNGLLADLKIYRSLRVPEDVTSIVPPKGPRLNLKRGISLDRIQRSFPIPSLFEISSSDINIIRKSGFDHVKILFTANSYISDSGLNMDNMPYVEKVVNKVLDAGLPALICLHPEPDFKFKYLGNEGDFRNLIRFYTAFADFIAKRWNPGQVAFQLMTEPHGAAYGSEFTDWNIIYRQLVQAVRSSMDKHTLVIPGNRVGSVFGMTSMKPIQDENVYYSFTSHEPFQFGMGPRFGDYMGAGKYWNDISYIPWPSSPEIINKRMSLMLQNVGENDRSAAEKDLMDYGASYYDKQWTKMRANHIKNWNDSYGGNLKIMIVEFGCLDHIWVRRFGLSQGVYPKERLEYLKDMRESFESIGMGWVYWSFNEACTVLNPASRYPYGYVSEHHIDKEMLSALGLKD